LTLTEIAHLQNNKTGALIEWSATAGAVMMGADPALLRRYAQSLGLAFQIADDILDVEGTIDVVGKATGKDSALARPLLSPYWGLRGPSCGRKTWWMKPVWHWTILVIAPIS